MKRLKDRGASGCSIQLGTQVNLGKGETCALGNKINAEVCGAVHIRIILKKVEGALAASIADLLLVLWYCCTWQKNGTEIFALMEEKNTFSKSTIFVGKRCLRIA